MTKLFKSLIFLLFIISNLALNAASHFVLVHEGSWVVGAKNSEGIHIEHRQRKGGKKSKNWGEWELLKGTPNSTIKWYCPSGDKKGTGGTVYSISTDGDDQYRYSNPAGKGPAIGV